MKSWQELWLSYRLRVKRRRLLLRALRKHRELRVVTNRTAAIKASDILAFSTVRNEMQRLPHFLDHHRKLGVQHFLIVDNASTDGTLDYLSAQPDISVWETSGSYKKSRFGVDWLTGLQARYGHDHWCLTLDADELFIYPFCDTRPLLALTEWLDRAGTPAFGALMLDLYPRGHLEAADPDADPVAQMPWFDSGNYTIRMQPDLKSLWIQGGVRARHFFANNPRQAPTLNKTPLVKWHRRYAYVNSTHALLPTRLNLVYNDQGGEKASGILLHTKMLPGIVARSQEEKTRREHFGKSAAFNDYYDALIADPVLWCDQSRRYLGWRQLESIGLMSRGLWL